MICYLCPFESLKHWVDVVKDGDSVATSTSHLLYNVKDCTFVWRRISTGGIRILVRSISFANENSYEVECTYF